MHSNRLYTDHQYSPFCSCSSCDHAAQTRAAQLNERRAIASFLAPMWDSCEITYRIRNVEAVRDIGLCDEMPAGWVHQESYKVPEANGGGWRLMFEVQGSPRESDGAIVYRILQRMGAL